MTVCSAPCWALCLPTCCRWGSLHSSILTVINITVSYKFYFLLFYFAETQHQVAGHQPEDICQVSWCFLFGPACFFICMSLGLCLRNFFLKENGILMSMVTNNVLYSLVDHCIKIVIEYGSVFAVPVVTRRRRRWCVRRARWRRRCWRSSWSAWSPGSCWISSVSSVSVSCLYFHTSVANDFSQVDMNSDFFETRHNFLNARIAQLSKTWESSADLMLLTAMVQ